MVISDWILVGTTIFLGTIALLAPVVSEMIKRKILSPQIAISFEKNHLIVNKHIGVLR